MIVITAADINNPTSLLVLSHSTLRSTHHLKIQTVVGHSVEVSFETRHFAELRTELSFTNDQSVFKCHIVHLAQKQSVNLAKLCLFKPLNC